MELFGVHAYDALLSAAPYAGLMLIVALSLAFVARRPSRRGFQSIDSAR